MPTDRHLTEAAKALTDAIEYAASVLGSIVSDTLDTQTARQYARGDLGQIDALVARARSRLDLYASAAADSDEGVAGAAEGLRKAVGP